MFGHGEELVHRRERGCAVAHRADGRVDDRLRVAGDLEHPESSELIEPDHVLIPSDVRLGTLEVDRTVLGRRAQAVDPMVAHGSATGIETRLEPGGAGALLMLELIRPSYSWLFGFLSHPTLAEIQQHRDRDGFARLAELGATLPGFGPEDQTPTFKHLTRILIHNGGTLADITVADCREAFAAHLAYAVQKRTLWHWLLLQAGTFEADVPRDAHSPMKAGQRSVPELVDGYRVESVAVRAVLIDYLHERQAVLDYTSLAALASKLVLLFWRDLEIHHPGIDTFRLDDEIARGWKDRLRVVVHGKQRVSQRREDPNAILIAVRAFYTDINHWATEDPPAGDSGPPRTRSRRGT